MLHGLDSDVATGTRVRPTNGQRHSRTEPLRCLRERLAAPPGDFAVSGSPLRSIEPSVEQDESVISEENFHIRIKAARMNVGDSHRCRFPHRDRYSPIPASAGPGGCIFSFDLTMCSANRRDPSAWRDSILPPVPRAKQSRSGRGAWLAGLQLAGITRSCA